MSKNYWKKSNYVHSFLGLKTMLAKLAKNWKDYFSVWVQLHVRGWNKQTPWSQKGWTQVWFIFRTIPFLFLFLHHMGNAWGGEGKKCKKKPKNNMLHFERKEKESSLAFEKRNRTRSRKHRTKELPLRCGTKSLPAEASFWRNVPTFTLDRRRQDSGWDTRFGVRTDGAKPQANQAEPQNNVKPLHHRNHAGPSNRRTWGCATVMQEIKWSRRLSARRLKICEIIFF